MTRIVALHGFLGQPEDWTELRNALHELAPGIIFEAIHLPFRSAPVLPRTTAAWAKEFNRSQLCHRVARNILIGYSLGGRLALQAALDQPGLWDEVILVSSHPGCTDTEERSQRLKTDADWADRFNRLPWADAIEAWNRQTVFAGSREPERREGDYDRAALSQVLLNWSPARDDLPPEALVALRPKLHWYAGAKDTKYIKLFELVQTAGLLGEFDAIPEAGHRVIFDRPRDLARQLVLNLNL